MLIFTKKKNRFFSKKINFSEKISCFLRDYNIIKITNKAFSLKMSHSSSRMPKIHPKTTLQQNHLVYNNNKTTLKYSSRTITARSISRINCMKHSFLQQNNSKETFWKVFSSETLYPHLISTIIIFFLYLFKENFLINLCWVNKKDCPECSLWIKYVYLFTFVSLEYVIAISLQFFVVFSSKKTKILGLCTKSYYILCYFLIYLWYFLWDFKIVEFFDAKTPDFLIYLCLIFSSFFYLPIIIKENKTKWKKIKKRSYLNGLFIFFLASCITVLSYLMHALYDLLKDYDENAYQIFVLIFSMILEESGLWFCTKNYEYGHKDWEGSKLTVIFYAKIMFLVIYSLRIANFSTVAIFSFSFFFHIFSLLSFFFEVLTGKSFFRRIFVLFRNYIQRIRNKKPLKFKKIKKNGEIECLKIIGYQKFDIMFIYVPRLLSFICFKKWTISQPAVEVIEGCSSNVGKIKFYDSNLCVFIIIDVLFTFVIMKLVKENAIDFNFYYQYEKISFFNKILLYVGSQLFFEFVFMYSLTMTSYK